MTISLISQKLFSIFAPATALQSTPRPHQTQTRVDQAIDVAAERRALKNLDPRLLKDIGVTADDAAREAARPIWDLPAAR